MTVMIELVGDQPLPNFLAVKHFQDDIDQVLLVYTDEKKEEKRKLEDVLTKTLHVKVEKVETQAHDVSTIIQRLREKLNALHIGPQQQPVFNLTGGTKAMSLAATRVAQELNAGMMYIASQNRDVHIYHLEWRNNELAPAGDEKILPCITLKDVFDMHLGWLSNEQRNWEIYGPSKDKKGGGPFEELVAGTLQRHRDLVDEVVSRVITLNRQIEIDIAIRLGNHYGIIEAKSGENKKLKAVKQLSMAWPLLSTYARPFHVMTIPTPDDHKPLKDALGITSISLLSYDKEKNTISADDEIELMTRIEHAFEVPGVFSPYD